MASVNTGIITDANFPNLKEITPDKVRPEVNSFLVPGEELLQCFMSIRDQVVFTNKRVFVVNVQGLTGKKVSYFSYPYKNMLFFGIETAGLLDVDSELVMAFANGTNLQFDFKSKVDIKGICANIQHYIL